MLGYDYVIKHKKGKENMVVNTLSQKYEDKVYILQRYTRNGWLIPRHSNPLMVTGESKSPYRINLEN
jgi:hypothetical protein